MQYKQSIVTHLENVKDNDPTSFWKVLGELRDFDKETTLNPIGPDEWLRHFTNLMNGTFKETNSNLDKHMDEFVAANKDNIFNELNFRITENEVQKAIASLKRGKAAGQDLILNEMIKTGMATLTPVFTKLFNQILNSGSFPTAWRYNFLTPLHKKGDKHLPGNYRGIAVCSNMSKLFCSVLQRRLTSFLDQNRVIPVNQIGFKKKSRTSDHILTLKALVDKYLNKLPRTYLFACFVDFKSAFDSISRKAMMYKMVKVGIGGNFMNTIINMYKDVYYCVKLNTGYTPNFNSKFGVKQGCVLSPTLFNLYLYDLPDIFDTSCDPLRY